MLQLLMVKEVSFIKRDFWRLVEKTLSRMDCRCLELYSIIIPVQTIFFFFDRPAIGPSKKQKKKNKQNHVRI
jgi:hypothetical protein